MKAPVTQVALVILIGLEASILFASIWCLIYLFEVLRG